MPLTCKITTNRYPFGMLAQNYNTKSYRFRFPNQEKDDKIYGLGNSINFKYRITDTRLERFWSVNQLASKYPHISLFGTSFQSNWEAGYLGWDKNSTASVLMKVASYSIGGTLASTSAMPLLLENASSAGIFGRAGIGSRLAGSFTNTATQLAFNHGDINDLNLTSIASSFLFSSPFSVVIGSGFDWRVSKGYRGFGKRNTLAIMNDMSIGFLTGAAVKSSNIHLGLTGGFVNDFGVGVVSKLHLNLLGTATSNTINEKLKLDE